MKFVKMHGAGNDYVYIDCFRQTVDNPEDLAREISDRHFGVGGDGLILIEPSKHADVKMRIFNADGSEAEMCGNGVRCVAKYAFDHGLVDRTEITIETGAGNLPLIMYPNAREHIDKVRVNMGPPRLTRADLPMAGPADEQVINMDLEILDRTFQITCVSMGNPHCVIYVDDVANFPVKRYGYAIENHDAVPATHQRRVCRGHLAERSSPAHLGAWCRRDLGLRHRLLSRHRGRCADRTHRRQTAQSPDRWRPGDGVGRQQRGLYDRPGSGGFFR